MTKKKITGRSIRKNRMYSVKDAARVVGVKPRTVNRWTRMGLRTRGRYQRSHIIAGSDLKEFLRTRHRANKVTLMPFQMLCMKCKKARRCKDDIADAAVKNKLVSPSVYHVLISAHCEKCGTKMYRRSSTDEILKWYNSGILDKRNKKRLLFQPNTIIKVQFAHFMEETDE